MPILGQVVTSQKLPPNSYGGPFWVGSNRIIVFAASPQINVDSKASLIDATSGTVIASQSFAGSPTAPIDSFWVVPISATSYCIVVQYPDGGVYRSTITITGDTMSQSGGTIQSATTTSAPRGACSLVRRSTGELVAFFQGPSWRTMGTDYAQIYYSISTDDGVNWSAPALAMGGLAASVTGVAAGVLPIFDTAVAFTQDSNGDLWRVAITPANAVSTYAYAGAVGVGAATFSINKVSVGVNIVRAHFTNSAGVAANAAYGGATGTTNYAVNTLTDTAGSNNRVLDGAWTDFFAYDPGRPNYYRIIAGTNGTLYFRITSADFLSMIEFESPISGTYQRAHCNIYMKQNGDVVLGYIAYNSSNTLYYGEELIEAGADTSQFSRARFPEGTYVGGPFKVTNAFAETALYAIFPTGAGKQELSIYKSSDDGITWTIVGMQTLEAEIKSLSAFVEGASLTIATQTATGRVAHHSFSTSSETFSIANSLVFIATSLVHAYWGCRITRRSNNELVVVAMDATDSSSMSRLVSGTWQSPVGWGSGSTRTLISDDSSRVYGFNQSSSTPSGNQRILLANNTIVSSNPTNYGTGVGTRIGNTYLVPAKDASNNLTVHRGPFEDNFNNRVMNEIVSATNPHSPQNSVQAVAIANGTDKHVLYVDTETQSLKNDKDTGSGWGVDKDIIHGFISAYNDASTASLNFGTSSSASFVAQSFTSLGGSLSRAEFKISVAGSPSDGIYCELVDVLGGDVIATSQIFDGTALTTIAQKITFSFTTVNLVTGQKYYLILKRTGATSDLSFYKVFINNTSVYSGGGISSFTSGSWSSENTSDLVFNIGSSIGALAAQNFSGEDIIGYIYNDAGAIRYGELDAAPGLVYSDVEIPVSITATATETDAQQYSHLLQSLIVASTFTQEDLLTGTEPLEEIITPTVGVIDVVPIAKLQERFSQQLDGDLWETSAGATVISGRLRLPVSSDADYVATKQHFDIRGGEVFVRLVPLGTADEASYLEMASAPGFSVTLGYRDGNLRFYVPGGSTVTQTTTYDAIAHKWIKIREDSGTFYADTSEDGHIWVNQFSSSLAQIPESAQIQMLSDSTAPISGYAYFDNLNIEPPILTKVGPIGDVSATGIWRAEDARTTNMYTSISGAVSNDTTYVAASE